MLIKHILLIMIPIYSTCKYSLAQNDTIKKQSSTFFKVFAGSLNAIYNQNSANGSFDLAVQSYHYYFITGKASDSTPPKMNKRHKTPYKGFHFYLLNRAAIDLDTIQAIANNYITSLQASPLTFRLKKEFFLSKNTSFSEANPTPIVSIILTGDGRAIPHGDASNKITVGASAHLFMTLSASINRLEYDPLGKEIDNGTMYLKPTIGIGYGTRELLHSVLVDRKTDPIISSECRIGFKSKQKNVKDFSFLFRYTITKIKGPRIRAGIILSSL